MPIASPVTGVSMERRCATIGCSKSASRLIAVPRTAAARPIPIAQTNSPTVGVVNVGMSGTDSENVPNPVELVEADEDEGAYSGREQTWNQHDPQHRPTHPDASMSRNAPASGEPRSVLIAAKLAAAAITMTACWGHPSSGAVWRGHPCPLPIAMSGASGPRTTPRLRVAKDAMMMPGRSIGRTGPVVLNPSAGSWPAVPGRCWIVSPTSTAQRRAAGWATSRLSVEPEVGGQGREQVLLDIGHPFEEEVRDRATGTPRRAPMTSAST